MSIKLQREFFITIYPAQYLQTSPITLSAGGSFADAPLVQTAPPPAFFFTDPITKTVTIKNPFTMIMNVQRRALASMNTGNFQIYNLAPATRELLYKDYTDLLCMRRITVQAGYASIGNLSTIFDGNIMQCTSYRKQGSTNFVTEIDAYDYGFPVVNAITSKSFSGTNGVVPKNQVVGQLVNDLCAMGPSGQQLSPGYIHDFVDTNGNPITEYNRTICDSSWKTLQNETGNTCFIDNGRLNIMQSNEYFTSSFTVISAATGLLGTPKRSDTYIIVEMLFEPSLVVGQSVNLVSVSEPSYNGPFIVVGISHAGIISDAMGGKLQTTVTLYSFPKNAQLIAASQAGGIINV